MKREREMRISAREYSPSPSPTKKWQRVLKVKAYKWGSEEWWRADRGDFVVEGMESDVAQKKLCDDTVAVRLLWKPCIQTKKIYKVATNWPGQIQCAYSIEKRWDEANGQVQRSSFDELNGYRRILSLCRWDRRRGWSPSQLTHDNRGRESSFYFCS